MWKIFRKMQEKFPVYRLCFQGLIFPAVWAANRPESLIMSCLAGNWACFWRETIYPPAGPLGPLLSSLVPAANSSWKNVQIISIPRIAGHRGA